MKKMWFVGLLFLISACGGTSKKTGNGEYTIGVAMSSFSDGWMSTVQNSIKEKADALSIQTVFVNAEENSSKQAAQVDALIAQKVDALIVVITDINVAEDISDKALAAEIPLVFVNRYPAVKQPKGVYYIGSRETEAGEMQAKFLQPRLQPKDKVVVLMGVLDQEAAVKRSAGAVDALLQKGVYVLDQQPGNWKRSEGSRLTRQWLAEYGQELKAVIANNDDMALGAIDALEQAGQLSSTLVVGVDATPEAVQAIKEGKLAMSAYQNGKAQGSGAVQIAHDVLKGESVQAETWVPFELVTKANVTNY